MDFLSPFVCRETKLGIVACFFNLEEKEEEEEEGGEEASERLRSSEEGVLAMGRRAGWSRGDSSKVSWSL